MKPSRIEHLLLICVLSFGLLMTSSCAKKEEPEEKAGDEKRISTASVHPGGTYRYPLMNDPSTLDPVYVQDNYSETILHQIFDGLVRFDPFLTVLPALAETWFVEDNGKTYRFVLRENALFHNGNPVTVADVIFSISRLLRIEPPPGPMPHLLKITGATEFRDHKTDSVKGLEPIDARSLRIRLDEPHAPFLTALGMYQAFIVPKDEVTNQGRQFALNPVGSGPFRFVSWEKNKSIWLERFPDYYAGASLLDKVHYIVYPGGKIEDVLADFRAKKLEEMPVYGKIREELSADSSLQWFHRPSLSLLFYGVRGNHPLLENPEIRKALSMAIDRDTLVKEVYKGQFDPARSIIPPGMPAYRGQSKTVVENTDEARKLVQTVLGENPDAIQPIEIVSAIQSSFAQAELGFVQQSWAQLGIPLEIKYITDWKEFSTYRRSDSVQIYRAAWFADMPDPDSFLQPLFASESPVNYMRFRDKDVDTMLQAARSIIDPVKRAEMYQQIEEAILASTPMIPLFYLSVDRVYQPFVRDIQVSALGAHTMPLHRIWLTEVQSQP